MREAFHEQLDALAEQLGAMCGLASVAMERASRSLLDADLELAESVISDHEQLIHLRNIAETDVLLLLALQAPVAGDLRAVVSTMQNVADAERMGGLALHVAKIVRRRHPSPVVPADIAATFAEMGRVAVEVGDSARDAVLGGDPALAARIRTRDDAMDDLHSHLFTILMGREWVHGVECAVDITLLGRFHERFGDHAVEIGRRVIFQVTGQAAAG